MLKSKLSLTKSEQRKFFELNNEACALYNALLERRQEALARGKKPKGEMEFVLAAGKSLPAGTAKEILRALKKETARGNYSRRIGKFFPLAFRRGDFLIDKGRLILLLPDRVLTAKIEQDFEAELLEGIKRIVISQDWSTKRYLVWLQVRKKDEKKGRSPNRC